MIEERFWCEKVKRLKVRTFFQEQWRNVLRNAVEVLKTSIAFATLPASQSSMFYCLFTPLKNECLTFFLENQNFLCSTFKDKVNFLYFPKNFVHFRVETMTAAMFWFFGNIN